MNILILGGTGFIGTNLVCELCKDESNYIWVQGSSAEHFSDIASLKLNNVSFLQVNLLVEDKYEEMTQNIDMVYHLYSTNSPGTSNTDILSELHSNVAVTTKLLEACLINRVGRVVFISSGGAIYGKSKIYPLSEDMIANPISSYGIQKLTIEKLLHLYHYQNGLDYRIIRLGNPYGPYQRPDGKLGVVTTFVYKALCDEKIQVYGDGAVVRDYIYIDDAIEGIIKIANTEKKYKLFNVSSGIGTSINEIINRIKGQINSSLEIEYLKNRPVDVPFNYLDITRYENCFGNNSFTSLEVGIEKTAHFLMKKYKG